MAKQRVVDVIDLASSQDESEGEGNNQFDNNDEDDDDDVIEVLSSSQVARLPQPQRKRKRQTEQQAQFQPSTKITADSIYATTATTDKDNDGPYSYSAMYQSNTPIFVFDDAENSEDAMLTQSLLTKINAVLSPQGRTCTSTSTSSTTNGTNTNATTNLMLLSLPLSDESFVHIQQPEKYSCGFRNTQMLLAPLLSIIPKSHAYFSVVPSREVTENIINVPTMLHVQHLLEQAWQNGYDPQGARHYNHTIVGKTGKKVEIGAVEVLSLLTYCGIDATVVQFVKCHESRRLLGPFLQAYFAKKTKACCPFCSARVTAKDCAQQLLTLVEGDSTTNIINDFVCQCNQLPIYLQWQGHSVTIVGIDGSGDNLGIVVFDPLKDGNKLCKALTGARRDSSRKSVFIPLKSLMRKKPDFQIVMCSIQSLTYSQKTARKVDMAVLTAAKDVVMRITSGRR